MTAWLLLGAALLTPAMAGPRPPAVAAAAIARSPEPVDIPGVRNFARVSDCLYRGAQPTRQGFAELRRRGIRTVVNLRAVRSDRDTLRGLGLDYLHLSAKAWHPEDEDLVAFLRLLRDPATHPVFVHCQHGADRTGSAIAVYRMVAEGWPLEEAVAEMRRFGFHVVWWQIQRYLRRFDAASAREQLLRPDARTRGAERVP